jgi:hypothetical protein
MPNTTVSSIIPPGFRKNQDKVAKKFNREVKNALKRVVQKDLKRRVHSRKQLRKEKQFNVFLQVAEEFFAINVAEESKVFLDSLPNQNRGVPTPNGWEVRTAAWRQQQQENHQQQDQQQQDQLLHAFDLRLDQRTREFIDFKSGRSE